MALVLRFLRRPETLALVALLVVGTLVNLATPDARRVGLDSYSSYDATNGGYRAWYQLLQKEGYDVGRFERDAAFLDASTATLVYAEPVTGSAVGPADENALTAWVKGGGDLVYLGHDDVASVAGFLDLPATQPPQPLPAKPRAKGGSAPATATPRPSRGLGRQITTITQRTAIADRAKRYRVACGCVVGTLVVAPELRARFGVARLAPRSDARWYPARGKHFTVLVHDARGPFVVRYPLGRGSVTAVIDQSVVDDARIATPDAARFALALAGAPPRRVDFDEVPHGHYDPEHWYDVVPFPFVVAIGVTVVAVLIAIGGAAVRLGPPLIPVPREPTSVEFVDSLAGLYERNHAAHATIADALLSVRRTVATAFGLPSATPLPELLDRLRGDGDRERLRDLAALAALDRPDDAALVRALTHAQHLRKDYVHGARH